MLNELKNIANSQKARVLILFMVLAIVAAMVVFAANGVDEYQGYGVQVGYYYEYCLQDSDYFYQVGYAYDDGYGYDTFSYDEYLRTMAALDEYLCHDMAGELGEAPTMLYDPSDYD